MVALPNHRMTVDEYLAWAQRQSGRFELLDGRVYAMTPERAAHAQVKLAIHMAFVAAIRARRLPCHVLPDGMTVRVDETAAYEPAAIVYCGSKLPPSALEVTSPIIVVEVLLPSSQHIDAALKLAGYFRLPSVAHYLIVDPDKPLVIHHSRRGDEAILTRIVHEGVVTLDPPGLELSVADIYADSGPR
jgi:Uma2 family endonuclease